MRTSGPPDAGGSEPVPRPSLVVGLGASAGGIRALQAFFTHLPPSSGAAYVVILHLSPEHDSRLAEVLQASTAMPVVRVTGTAPLLADHVYVISPKTTLRMVDGVLEATGWVRAEERRAPIDIFFRALAEAHGSRAVGIVLSGTGSDGSSGIRRMKEYGGLTIAQDPGEAEHADMPQSAIGGGLVDYVLPVAEMPGRLEAYAREAGQEPPLGVGEGEADHLREGLREILALLRVRTGQDFSHYKTATLLRRIDRRRHLHDLPDVEAYARFLRDRPEEPPALLQELLISVTNFFRDPAPFAALEARVLPVLFHPPAAPSHVRAWVAGCATGEEAYSVAMLLAEASADAEEPPTLQVFATDLNTRALAVAREAFYSDADTADVSPERLQRFFVREPGGYRVRRELREIVLFATHNVLKDPPFSHLDLICCRNLLIYLTRTAQERLFDTFHFALRPGRYLFLGGSESLPGAEELFATIDTQARIFESRPGVRARAALPVLEPTPRHRPPALVPRPPAPGDEPPRASPADVHLQLLEQFGPPSVVVTEGCHLVHLSERAAGFLRVSGGEPTRDLLKLAPPDLRVDLRTALYQAGRDRLTVVARGVQWVDGDRVRHVDIEVRPVLGEGDPARGFFVVFFDEPPTDGAPPEATAVEVRAHDGDTARQLEQELLHVKGQLRSTVEQYETQVEEARASNEELQAVNEELRSSAEELETSKEELQSVNEELTTVNQELKVKLEELGARNNDFQNLINSTDIGTIFLDRRLRVKFATPRVRDVFNLLPQDTGRSLTDITSTLVHDGLYRDIEAVLERLQPIEREVQSLDGRCYLLRILPYRTLDDRIEGAVLTFQDMTAGRRAESEVRASEERLRLLIDSVIDYAIFTIRPDGRIASWNAGAVRLFGFTAEDAIGQPFGLLFTPEDRQAGVPDEELARARADGHARDERWHVRKDGSRIYCSGVTTPLGDSDTRGFATIARDLTAARQAQHDLEQAHGHLEARVRERTQALEAEMHDRGAAEQRATDLVRRLVATQEDERARMARDLHDQIGQQMTALRLSLERLQAYCRPDERAVGEVVRALAITREIDTELDFLAWELRPAVLDDLGLVAAASRYLDSWSAHMGIPAEFRTAGLHGIRLGPDTETAFYRVLQEALNNAAKHAHASRVDVIIERHDASIVLVVEDDGVGFETDTAHGRLGIPGMRERAALAGAELQIESTPGQGTSIFLRCALPEAG
jgi:two-component system, chemotaxis family, CheB/CheR fusion protein